MYEARINKNWYDVLKIDESMILLDKEKRPFVIDVIGIDYIREKKQYVRLIKPRNIEYTDREGIFNIEKHPNFKIVSKTHIENDIFKYTLTDDFEYLLVDRIGKEVVLLNEETGRYYVRDIDEVKNV